MRIYPAIDLIDQKCVRLAKGIYTEQSVYADDPVSMAQTLVAEGAQQLHIIDLDAAINRSDINDPVIEAIRSAVDVPIQVGGGIRDMTRARQLIERGIDRLIVSTAVITDPEFFAELLTSFREQIAVSVDARGDQVLIRGWAEESDRNLFAFCRELLTQGVRTIIYTDTERDGMLTGPNLETLAKLQALPGIQLIAAGGVSSIDDLDALRTIGLYGAITGKALYEHKITMREIKRFQEEHPSDP